MSHVILEPNTRDNHSKKFRVVDYDDWFNFTYGNKHFYAHVSFDTRAEAEKHCNELNKKEQHEVY